jgi:hypothetical protein
MVKVTQLSRVLFSEGLRKKVLFSSYEKKGDVYIAFPCGKSELYEDIGLDAFAAPNLRRIKSRKISIHQSPSSKTGINEIKHGAVIVGREGNYERISSNFTRAIKIHNRYTPLYFEICSSMNDVSYDAGLPRSADYCGGKLDPNFTLFYALLCSGRNRSLDLAFHQLRFYQFHSSMFNLYLLWSFIPLKAGGRSFHAAARTASESEISNQLHKYLSESTANGLDEDQIGDWYFDSL